MQRVKPALSILLCVGFTLSTPWPAFSQHVSEFLPTRAGLRLQYAGEHDLGTAVKLVHRYLPPIEIPPYGLAFPRHRVVVGKEGVSVDYVVRSSDAVISITRRDAFARSYTFLRGPLEIGTTWAERIPIDLPFRDGRVEVDLESAISAVGETVTVLAGHFRGCVKVTRNGSGRRDFFFPDGESGILEVTVTGADWYTKGVGPVKGEMHAHLVWRSSQSARTRSAWITLWAVELESFSEE